MFVAGKPWPVIFGMGVGLGHGVANCQNDYKSIATMKHTPKVTHFYFSLYRMQNMY